MTINDSFHIYDTTLRDGAQQEGLNLSVHDKLTIARHLDDLGYKTEETMISIDDWRDGVKSGEITEIFACGTAAVVSAVGSAKSIHGTWQTGDGNPGPITNQIRQTLLGIQHGDVADKHGWNKRVI